MAVWAQFRMDASRHVSRGVGGSAVAAAAYRAGERLFDEREDIAADYSGRYGVVANGLVMPEAGGPDWSREQLWNAAEAAERRKDARTARKMELALPDTITAEQRHALVAAWADELANRYGVAVDWAIHLPDREGDHRNHHAHLMLTTRQVGPEGFREKAPLELSNSAQKVRGLPVGDQAIQQLRQVMADRFNVYAEDQALELRVDACSYRERGIELEPTKHIGVAAVGMDRRNKEADRFEVHRATRYANARAIEARPEVVLETLSGREAVFTRRDIARELHRYIDEPAAFTAILARLEASAELVQLDLGTRRDDTRFSTREMVRVEAAMANEAEALSRSPTHGVAPDRLEKALATHSELSDEQRSAVAHITSARQVAAIIGSAGAGKSRSLAAARLAWEAEGYRVYGAALAGKAAEELQRSAGMQSRTIASLEFAWRKGREQLTARDVLVIDEAGMVGSRQLGRVLEEAKRTGAKVVLVGDERQLQPIEAGAAFRAVVERIGAAEIRSVRRNRETWAREASQAFARGNVAAGLDAYAERGHIRMTDSRDDAKAAIARDYVGEASLSRLVLAHTNVDVLDMNARIRSERQKAGGLTGEVEFAADRGARHFAAGDRLVFLGNDRTLDVKNGTLGTIESASPGRLAVRLDAPDETVGRLVTVDQTEYDKVDHGYAVTMHKSQGATVDRTYVLASAGMDQHLTYVAMTRHRDTATLYAGRDDFRDERTMRSRLSRSRPKETTLDFADRRGFDTPSAWIEDAKAVLERSRERLGDVWQRVRDGIIAVRDRMPQLPGGRTSEATRQAELRQALQKQPMPSSTKTRNQIMDDISETAKPNPDRISELKRAVDKEQTTENVDRDALRREITRESGPAPRSTDDLRRALEKPDQPEAGRETNKNRGAELER